MHFPVRAVLGPLLFASLAGAQAKVDAYLRNTVKLSDSEMASVAAGTPVSKLIPTGEKAEVIVFGAVFLRAQPAAFVQTYKANVIRTNGTSILAAGIIPMPPRVASLARLSLPREDVESLRECEVGDCDLQLTQSSFNTLKHAVNWHAANPASQVDQLLRQRIVELVAAYQKSGNSVLGTYVDGSEPVNVARTFEALLSHIEAFRGSQAPVRNFLFNYPMNPPPGLQNIFYWQTVKFGLKPTVRVVQLGVFPGQKGSDVSHFLIGKQLYATHYFQTSVEIWACVADPARKDGFYLLTFQGSRQRGLTGFSGSILRDIVVRKTESSMRDALIGLKQRLEK